MYKEYVAAKECSFIRTLQTLRSFCVVVSRLQGVKILLPVIKLLIPVNYEQDDILPARKHFFL